MKLTRKQLAKYVTTAVMSYFRFKRQFPIVASEAGGYHSDILCIKENEIVEVEVKVDISDFEADFKKRKHVDYKNNTSECRWKIVPDKFYFAVPEEMKEYCLKRIKEQCPEYGLIIVSEPIKDRWNRYHFPVFVKKSCRKFKKSISNSNTINQYKEVIVARISSQLCGLLEDAQKVVLKEISQENGGENEFTREMP